MSTYLGKTGCSFCYPSYCLCIYFVTLSYCFCWMSWMDSDFYVLQQFLVIVNVFEYSKFGMLVTTFINVI